MHSVPCANHLGREKTMERITSQFRWLGIHKEVKDYCMFCLECQLTGHKNTPRAPLMPMPVIDALFERIDMDLIG